MAEEGVLTKRDLEEGDAFSLLRLLEEERLTLQGPDEEGRYVLGRGSEEPPAWGEALVAHLEASGVLRVPAERLGKDLRRFLGDRDLTGGGLLLLASRRLFLLRTLGPDEYGVSMDLRFQQNVPRPEVRLEHLIGVLRAWEGRKGLFRVKVLRVYRAVELPGLLLEEAPPPCLSPAGAQGLPVEGRVFVLAGGLGREDRARAKALITAQGGRCAGSLSGKTDYLASGAPAQLRENTLLQLQALRAKGHEVLLLDPEALFALLGEPIEEAPQPEAQPIQTEALPLEAQPEPEVSPLQAEPQAAEAPAQTTPPASQPEPETQPIQAEPQPPEAPAALNPLEAQPESEAAPLQAEPQTPEAPAQPSPLASQPDPETQAPAEALPLNILTEAGLSDVLPEVPASPDSILQAALDQNWKAAWASTMEASQAETEQAIAEKTAQIQKLQEARQAEELRLQDLGLLKFGERAAARQALQKLNQALRTAEAELARLRPAAVRN